MAIKMESKSKILSRGFSRRRFYCNSKYWLVSFRFSNF